MLLKTTKTYQLQNERYILVRIYFLRARLNETRSELKPV